MTSLGHHVGLDIEVSEAVDLEGVEDMDRVAQPDQGVTQGDAIVAGGFHATE